LKRKQKHSTGRLGPVAGLLTAIHEAPTTPPENLAKLLKQHRENKGKDKAVVKALMEAFAYLPYRKYTEAIEQGRWYADDLLGQAFYDLGICIERLAENQMPAERVESYIKNELFHSRKHLVMKDTISLDPPPSTVAYRKKKGLEPLPEPVRVRTIRPTRWEPNPEFPTSPLEDPACAHKVQPKYGKARVPSRFDQPPVGKDIDDEDSYNFLADTFVKAAESPLEKTVAGMVRTGHSGNDIARSLNVNRKQITKIIGLLRTRVGPRVGIEVTPAEPLTDRPAPNDVLDLPVPRSSLVPAANETAWQAIQYLAV